MKLKYFIIILSIALHFSVLRAQQRHVVKKLRQVNSNFQSDFGTSFYGDSAVVFASTRKWKGQKAKIWNGNGLPYLDLYVGDINDDKDIYNVRKFGGGAMNTEYHESNVTFTKDSSTVYFTRNNYFDRKFHKDSLGYNLIQLYKAEVNDKGVWEKISPLPFNSKNYQTGHPALNAKEDKLYFTSDMPGTFGETDIFVVDIYEDGSYGDPINLGPNVNTYGKEMFPFIDGNDLLFFSSNGYSEGRGDLDIYVAKIAGNQAISLAMNVGAPINSNKDDFSITIKPGTDWGYFSSNRKTTKADDIYYFEFYQGFSSKVYNAEFAGHGACANVFEGVVKEEGTQALLPGALVGVYDNENKLLVKIRSNDFGRFAFKLPCNEQSYTVAASKKFYKDNKITFTNGSTRQESGVGSEQTNFNLNLKPTKFINNGVGEASCLLANNMSPIYFDLDKYHINEDAAKELERIIWVLKKYPDLQIQVASYTDSRGDNTYNMELSEKRSRSVKGWLIYRGIDEKRLTAKGYGETNLVNKCTDDISCTEVEHQLNRRTEFVVMNTSLSKEN